MGHKIYDMKLHERIDGFSSKSEIVRVPGGWLYVWEADHEESTRMVFVPYNNEFQVTSDDSVPF